MPKQIEIITIKKPKGRPRGDPSALKPYLFDNTPEGKARAAACSAKKKNYNGGAPRISVAYTMLLSQKLPDDVKKQMGLDAEEYDGITWADAIAVQTGKRALGVVEPERIGFTAITELRETTEGKNPDKSEVAGPGGSPFSAPPIQVQFIKPKRELHEEEEED